MRRPTTTPDRSGRSCPTAIGGSPARSRSTDTDPQIWAGLLANGVPFSALQERAAEVVRKRVEFFRARKRRKSA